MGILLASSSGRHLLCHRQVVLPTAWLLLELLVEWLCETSRSLLLLALRHRISDNSLLLCRILWLTVGSLWLFFIQMRSIFQNVLPYCYAFLPLLEFLMKTVIIMHVSHQGKCTFAWWEWMHKVQLRALSCAWLTCALPHYVFTIHWHATNTLPLLILSW